jgi:hypothetical protein
MLLFLRNWVPPIVLLALLGGCHLIYPFPVDPAPGQQDAALFDSAAHDLGARDARLDVSGDAADLAVDVPTNDVPTSDLTTDLPPKLDIAPLLPPTVTWARAFGGGAMENSWDVLAHAGQVVITGSFQSTMFIDSNPLVSKGGTDILLASFDSAAKLQAVKQFGDTALEQGLALAPGIAGTIVAAGSFSSVKFDLGGMNLLHHGGSDGWVASYAPGLTHAWSRSVGSTSFDYVRSVATDAQGNIYIVGEFTNEIDLGGGKLTAKGLTDLFVASYSAAGVHRWSKNYGASGAKVRGLGVATDSSGLVLVTGAYDAPVSLGGPTLPAKTVFVASYKGTTGGHKWSKGFASTTASAGLALAADASGNVYVTGTIVGDVKFGTQSHLSHGSNDLFLASFTAAGVHRWAKLLGTYSSDEGYDVAVDGAGNVYITGNFSAASIELGGGLRPNKGYKDILVASYTSTGSHRWSMTFGGINPDFGNGVALDGSGAIYLTGTFQKTVSFGSFPLKSNGVYDIFLLKLTP